MKAFVYSSVLILIFAFAAGGSAVSNFPNSNFPKDNSDSSDVCIVSGEKLGKNVVVYKYLNRDVKLCCEGCEQTFKKNPAKYLGSAGLWCPVCDDGDAKETISTDSGDVKYYFCSKSCKKKFEKNPDKYLNNYK